jgi:hypothetical protein
MKLYPLIGKWGIGLIIKTKTALHWFVLGFHPDWKRAKFYVRER